MFPPPFLDKLLLTAFRLAIVPPPMASEIIQFAAPVNQVTFAPPPFCNDLCVVLSNGEIVMLRDNYSEEKAEKSNGREIVAFPR